MTSAILKFKRLLFVFFILTAILLAGCDALKSNCDNCNGTGKTNCSTCSGIGKTNCTTCSGAGNSNCSWCTGQGKKNCTQCNGMGTRNIYVASFGYKDGFQMVTASGYSGYTQVIGGSINVRCQTCSGAGTQKCSNISCDNGKVKCSNYSCEEGKVKCSNFSCKDGKIDCYACKGTGKK